MSNCRGFRLTEYFRWVELVFNPRNQFESYVSTALRAIHPYLAFITYRFHVEKAREAGIRVEDFYMHKFHKEPYVMWHIYAQYFHPNTLLERVRDVSFYRRPRTLFKGFKVPDWATAEKTYGWEADNYSVQAWENAWNDFKSEITPMQCGSDRQEPNPLQWFRFEQVAGGTGSRLFYNEVPKPTWLRYNGHLDNAEETLYSFTKANQQQPLIFGIDTSTEEGRALFKAEYDAIAEIAPEIVKKEKFAFPHELPDEVPQEPHYQRVWRYYREHNVKRAIESAASKGQITSQDADLTLKFLKNGRHLSFKNYVQARVGNRPDLEQSEEFKAAEKVLGAIGLNQVDLDLNTAQPYEDQFNGIVDDVLNLTASGLKADLPVLVAEETQKRKVEEILSRGEVPEIAEDETQKLL